MVAIQFATLLLLNEEYMQQFLKVSTSQLSIRQRMQPLKSLPLQIGASINAAKHVHVSSDQSEVVNHKIFYTKMK